MTDHYPPTLTALPAPHPCRPREPFEAPCIHEVRRNEILAAARAIRKHVAQQWQPEVLVEVERIEKACGVTE